MNAATTWTLARAAWTALTEAPSSSHDMPAAPWPDPATDRLLLVDPASERLGLGRPDDLATVLRPGDLLVLNDAATLPARLVGRLHGQQVELRLAEWRPSGRLRAVLFGPGSWREDTDRRAPPPTARRGDRIALEGDGEALVLSVSANGRLLQVRLHLGGDALLAWLYDHGRPVQYSYAAADLPLALVQTAFAGRPWAVEMPSAGRPLTWQRLQALKARGVRIARLTHGAGLSATGDPALDATLPLPEPYELPPETVAAVMDARARGGRVVAVGTTVVRALEDAALRGLPAGRGLARLVIGSSHTPAVVDGLITNMHGPGESHFRLAEAFAPRGLLDRAHRDATAQGLRAHEFGDVALILAGTVGG